MSKEITLPSGATVKLRDADTLRVKDRKRLMKVTDTVDGETSKALAIGDELAALLIEEWSFDLIIPSVNMSSLDELTIPDYDALVEAGNEAAKILFPKIGKTEEAESDPKALTVN